MMRGSDYEMVAEVLGKAVTAAKLEVDEIIQIVDSMKDDFKALDPAFNSWEFEHAVFSASYSD